MICDFYADLEFSMNENAKLDCETIKAAIPNCVTVYKTDKKTDKKGIDYIAVLDHGAKINIDAKRRKAGVRKVNGYPECALEIWSVMPDKANNVVGKAGWTCSRSTDVDMILYVFDNSEWDKFYLVPFQHLRAAFQKNAREWAKIYRVSNQLNEAWTSQCMFVPANVLIQAVADEMIHTIRQ